MDVINIIPILLVILCKQIVAQEKSEEHGKQEDSLHVNIDNNENKLRKSDPFPEKYNSETPSLKYTKNEYEYNPVKMHISSNTTQQNDTAENLPKLLDKTIVILQETPRSVKKKDTEHIPPETDKQLVIHSETLKLDGSEIQKTNQLEKSPHDSHSHEHKATDHIHHKHNCSSESVNNADNTNSRKRIDEDHEALCPDNKTNNGFKSDLVVKDTKYTKTENRADSGRANKKKGKVLFFEEIDNDKEHSEIRSKSTKSKPVFKVYEAYSNDKSSSPVSDDLKIQNTDTASSKVNSESKEIIQRGNVSDNIVSNNKKNSIPAVSPDLHLKTAIPIEKSKNDNDISTGSELLRISEKQNFFEENNLKRQFKPSSEQTDQETTNVINLVRSTLDDAIGPSDDIIVKTYNVDEVIETYKIPDDIKDKKCSCSKDNVSTNELYTIVQYIIKPQNTQQRYVETARYTTPIYDYNYPKIQYDQNSISQQNYYYRNFAQQYNPYIYNPYRDQSYYPKVAGEDYAYASPFGYYNQFKPDYTYVAPSFKYPFEDQLQDTAKPSSNNYITKWNTGNYQKRPGMYPYYQPIVFDYSKANPDKLLDKIRRSWQNTEIQIKRPITEASTPTDKSVSRNLNRRNLNRRPLSYFNNQRKRVSNGNGYY